MNSSMDRALSGMRAAQVAIDVTSHNIANASTEGYARQRVNFTSKPGYLGRSSLIGGGVEVASVQRIADRFVTRQIRQQVGEQGYYGALESRLSDIESIFNEADDNGLQAAFGDFYSGLAVVASHPEDAGVRVTAMNSGQLMASKLRGARERLMSTGSRESAATGIRGRAGQRQPLADRRPQRQDRRRGPARQCRRRLAE